MTAASRLTFGPRWKQNFAAIWLGQQISILGSTVAGFALVWWLTQRTGSATVLATASLVAMLPSIVLGPVAGAYVDRWNRRTVMIVADAAIAFVSLWLAILFWAGRMQVWHVYVMMLARSLGGCFHEPASMSSNRLLVPEEHLARVQGLSQMVQGALKVAGPPMGALLLAWLPLHGIMLIDVGTAALAIALLLVAHIPQPARADLALSTARPSIWADVREGIRYVVSWPGLLTVLLMATFLNFTGVPMWVLLPLLVTKHFGGGALQLGWMESAWGIGLLVGGLALSAWGGFRRKALTAMVGIVLQGVSSLIVGFSPPTAFWLAAVAWGLGAFFNVFVNGPFVALLQSVVKPEMQGRIFTVTMSLAGLAMPLGLALAGPAADHWGITTLYLFAGSTAVLCGAGGLLVPAIMRIEDQAKAQEHLSPAMEAEKAPGA